MTAQTNLTAWVVSSRTFTYTDILLNEEIQIANTARLLIKARFAIGWTTGTLLIYFIQVKLRWAIY